MNQFQKVSLNPDAYGRKFLKISWLTEPVLQNYRNYRSIFKPPVPLFCTSILWSQRNCGSDEKPSGLGGGGHKHVIQLKLWDYTAHQFHTETAIRIKKTGIRPMFFVWSGAFAATKYNKFFSGYQPCQVAEWRKNQPEKILLYLCSLLFKWLISNKTFKIFPTHGVYFGTHHCSVLIMVTS
jgi:hypothetical protein